MNSISLSEKIEVFPENNLLTMSRFPWKYFDFVLDDPPYGIGESGKNHNSRNTPIKQKNGTVLKAKDKNYVKKNWDTTPPPSEFWFEAKRISANQIIFGANYIPEIAGNPFKSPRRNEYESFLKEHPKHWIIWDKVNGDSDFSDCELIWTSLPIDSQIIYYMWAGMMQGTSMAEGLIMQGNKKLNQKRIHPTEKPIPVYGWIFQNLIGKGKKVYDGHLGSGSVLEVAEKFDTEFVASEIESDYINGAISRYRQSKVQYSLPFQL